MSEISNRDGEEVSSAENKEERKGYVSFSAETESEAKKIHRERQDTLSTEMTIFLTRKDLSKEDRVKINEMWTARLKEMQQDCDEDIAYIIEQKNGGVEKEISDFEKLIKGI